MIEAAVEAKQQGLIGGIGVYRAWACRFAATHRRSLERFDFNSVLLPYNFITLKNEYYAANFNRSPWIPVRNGILPYRR